MATKAQLKFTLDIVKELFRTNNELIKQAEKQRAYLDKLDDVVADPEDMAKIIVGLGSISDMTTGDLNEVRSDINKITAYIENNLTIKEPLI